MPSQILAKHNSKQRSRKEKSTSRDDEDKTNHGLMRTTSNNQLMDQGPQQRQTRPNRSPATLEDNSRTSARKEDKTTSANRATRRKSRGVLLLRKMKIANLLTPRAPAAKTSPLSVNNLSVRNNTQKEDRKHTTSTKIRKKPIRNTISKSVSMLTGTIQTKPARSISKRRRSRTSTTRRKKI